MAANHLTLPFTNEPLLHLSTNKPLTTPLMNHPHPLFSQTSSAEVLILPLCITKDP